jgi:hypothetical protein
MGKIELDHTGSGAGITLSSDGTDLLLDGTAIGGGGSALELYAENPSSPTAPSATGTNAVAIGNGAVATAFGSISIGFNSSASANYSFSFGRSAVASSTDSVAIGKSANAAGFDATAIGTNTDATSTGALAVGHSAQAKTGSYATAISRSYASGADSFAAAISNSGSSYGATGGNSVAVGPTAKATGSGAFSIGKNSFASGGDSGIFGVQSIANSIRSYAFGAYANAGHAGKIAFSNNRIASAGDTQAGLIVLRVQTTSDTPAALTTGAGGTADTTNQVILPNNSAYAFHGTIVARQSAATGTASAAWKVEGLIRSEANAASTVLVNSALTVLDNTPAWGLALTADTTNGGLKIEVTGAAATNIRWVATINTSEVTYA